jgi:hypothetical protein
VVAFAGLVDEDGALAFDGDNLRRCAAAVPWRQQYLRVRRMRIIAKQPADGFKLGRFPVLPAAVQDEKNLDHFAGQQKPEQTLLVSNEFSVAARDLLLKLDPLRASCLSIEEDGALFRDVVFAPPVAECTRA